MKPLTTDQPRALGQQSQQPQQSGAYTWAFDEEQQRLLLDINNKDISTSSTSSNSPPFSMGSASSPLDGNRPLTTVPYGSHIVGAHRRQHSTIRHPSTDNVFRPPGHPYAVPTSLSPGSLHPHLARRRRLVTQMDAMTEDQHLDHLWSMHGVTGSAHLGAGLTDQLASASLHNDEWIPSGLQTPTIDEVLDSAYYGAAINADRFTTVDPSLRQTYEVHNPFTEDFFHHFGEEDTSHSHEADMDLVEDHLDIRHDESPLSEEPEPKDARRSKSADSGITAGRNAPAKAQAQADDDKDHAGSDHEHNDDDEKAHTSKPSSNNFVNKLHLMISDPKAADFIWWTELGTSFVVSSAGEFSRSILGQHFKHNNFSSFVRQLNMYGFHKINRTPRNQRVQPDAQQWEFSHPKFLRGRQDLLEDIKRKPVEPDPSSARQRVELPSEVAAKLREMAVAHTEVVKALQVERGKVLQLTSIVKVLYDRVALSGPLPPFPLDLLESRPPLRASVKSAGMDLAGNSLVPSGPSTSSRATRSRATVGRTTRRGRSEEQDHADVTEQHASEPSHSTMLNGRIKSESNIFAR